MHFSLRPERQTFLCFFNMNLSQLLSISSHLASRCLSTALGISSALQRGRDSWTHLHHTGCVTVLRCYTVRCCVSSLSEHQKAWPLWKLNDTWPRSKKTGSCQGAFALFTSPEVKKKKKKESLTSPQMRVFMSICNMISQTRRKELSGRPQTLNSQQIGFIMMKAKRKILQ